MEIAKYDDFVQSSYQFTVKGTPNQIAEVLGFPSNYDDDASKVKNSWAFTVDGAGPFAIWDYKTFPEDDERTEFSAFGDEEVFERIFGPNLDANEVLKK